MYFTFKSFIYPLNPYLARMDKEAEGNYLTNDQLLSILRFLIQHKDIHRYSTY